MSDIWTDLAELAKRKAAERQTEPELTALDFGQAKQDPPTGGNSPKADFIERQQWRAEMFNRNPGNLGGYDCPECLNRGCSYRADEEGYLIAVPCRCMTIRENKRRMEASGLSDMLDRYTFGNWKTENEWQAVLLDGAKHFAEKPEGWFAVCGGPGTGKTHICTAICGKLMESGLDVRYMLWRDAATTLKAYSMDDAAAYSREIEPLKTVKALYIDDLFKTGNRQKPTVMDANLAFEIINARYNASGLITLISSERSLDELMRIDNATASRIYERTKQRRNYYNLAGKENWRMRQIGGNYGE